MADSHSRSSRNRDPSQFGGTNADDPLAELARMIGQGEPQSVASGARQARADHQDWAYDARYADQPEPGESDLEGGYGDHAAAEPFADPYSPHQAVYPGAQPDYGHARGDSDQAPRQSLARDEARYPVTEHHRDDYDSDHEAQPLPAFLPRPQDGHYAYDDGGEGSLDPSYDGEDYDEMPNGRRRGGFVLVAAVLGLAVLGTAGAFAYRAMFGGSMLATLPPIIKADNGPNKILPNTVVQGGSADRAGASSNLGEKLVSREEKPVDVPAAVSTAPRVVATIPIFPATGAPQPGGFPALPPGGMTAPAPTQAAPAPTQAAPSIPPQVAPPLPVAAIPTAPPPVSTEPKKIRTVSIRPDQADSSEAAVAAPSPPATAAPAAARPALPRPQGATVKPPSAPPPAGANAPLSIVPSQAEPPASAAARSRTALAQPTSIAPSASPAPSPQGSYAVQVSSQRSEAEAQAAFRALQAKFPGQLGGREAMVRRADLGAKGVYYRALVGPFASMEQAAGLCSSLKAAGGNCIVQRN